MSVKCDATGKKRLISARHIVSMQQTLALHIITAILSLEVFPLKQRLNSLYKIENILFMLVEFIPNAFS